MARESVEGGVVLPRQRDPGCIGDAAEGGAMAQKEEGRLRVRKACELSKKRRAFSTRSLMVYASQKAGGPMGAPSRENAPDAFVLTPAGKSRMSIQWSARHRQRPHTSLG